MTRGHVDLDFDKWLSLKNYYYNCGSEWSSCQEYIEISTGFELNTLRVGVSTLLSNSTSYSICQSNFKCPVAYNGCRLWYKGAANRRVLDDILPEFLFVKVEGLGLGLQLDIGLGLVLCLYNYVVLSSILIIRLMYDIDRGAKLSPPFFFHSASH